MYQAGTKVGIPVTAGAGYMQPVVMAPQPTVMQQYPQQQVVIGVNRQETYCGPLSWVREKTGVIVFVQLTYLNFRVIGAEHAAVLQIVGIFLFPCIVFCPIDRRCETPVSSVLNISDLVRTGSAAAANSCPVMLGTRGGPNYHNINSFLHSCAAGLLR